MIDAKIWANIQFYGLTETEPDNKSRIGGHKHFPKNVIPKKKIYNRDLVIIQLMNVERLNVGLIAEL